MRTTTIIVPLVTVLSTSSALQLSSISALPSDFNGSPGCVAAYESSISECTSADLAKSCSSSCQKALDAAASNIILSCRQATIPSSASLLKAAMGGGSSLGSAVCGSSPSDDADEEEEKEEPKSTKTPTTTTPPIVKSTSASSPSATDDAEDGLLIADDKEDSPSKSEKESASDSTSSDEAKSSATKGSSSDGGDPFSLGSGDAKDDEDSAAGGLKVMMGVVAGVVIGAISFVW